MQLSHYPTLHIRWGQSVAAFWLTSGGGATVAWWITQKSPNVPSSTWCSVVSTTSQAHTRTLSTRITDTLVSWRTGRKIHGLHQMLQHDGRKPCSSCQRLSHSHIWVIDTQLRSECINRQPLTARRQLPSSETFKRLVRLFRFACLSSANSWDRRGSDARGSYDHRSDSITCVLRALSISSRADKMILK